MIACPAPKSLVVSSPANCPNWSTLAWNPVPTQWHSNLWIGPYPLSYSLGGGALTMNAVVSDGIGNHFALFNGEATLTFTGGPCNCKLVVSITNWTFDTSVGTGGVGFSILQDGLQVASFARVNGQTAGTFTVPFTLAAGVNSLIEFMPGLFDGGVGGPVSTVFMYGYDDAPMHLSCTATLSNV